MLDIFGIVSSRISHYCDTPAREAQARVAADRRMMKARIFPENHAEIFYKSVKYALQAAMLRGSAWLHRRAACSAPPQMLESGLDIIVF